MPRACRYFLPGHVWHITHRCHKKEFLLKFARDRRAWVRWLFEAKKRYGLCILNYVATSNHVHLLVQDGGRGEIAQSMQLVAGRVAQEFNQRKSRKGAFWEDRYHATAVSTDHHLARCLTYIDLNMVRAGVVKDPVLWSESGYAEIMNGRQRYQLVDHRTLAALLDLSTLGDVRLARQSWIKKSLEQKMLTRDTCWTEGLAVGSAEFVEEIKDGLGIGGRYRDVRNTGRECILRENELRWGILPSKSAL
ncbi:putative transposase [Geoalkalibacter ferrihydriticus]|uniref:Putative transposase n=1 Tax=Geoalkalibacter ferrihydriticus TaxID=392333 RepID=A0A1G9IZB3_9BACT|nr:transposase [Geoalkalibacter ferrihydriticus]SDL30194.1 putative transposase [Geoalkalibacter ferrihydriticus]